MSDIPYYVLAANGRYYKNAIVAFDEGFVTFEYGLPQQVILWDHDPPHDPVIVLDRVLGVDGWRAPPVEFLGFRRGERLDITADSRRGGMRSARWASIVVVAPIRATPDLLHDGVFDRVPVGDSIVFDFSIQR